MEKRRKKGEKGQMKKEEKEKGQKVKFKNKQTKKQG